MQQDSLTHCPDPSEDSQACEILAQLRDKQILTVNPRRRNGLIICKRYHAEFAEPGAVVGGLFDLDCQQVLPVGNLSLLCPQTSEERRAAYLIRRQWVRLTKQITDNPAPQERARMILNQFEHYFGSETVAQLPDRALASLVGVLPQTIRKMRHPNARLGI